MRGKKAKRLREQFPNRPNPGRKHGGTPKLEKANAAANPETP